MTFVSTITVAITLFFIMLVYFGIENLDRWVEQYNDEATIVAYLELSLNDDLQDTVVSKANRIDGIETVTFISRTDAYHTFSSLYGKELLSSVEENPFPASLEISLHENVDAKQVEQSLTEISGIESVSVSRDWLEGFERFRKYLRIAVNAVVVIIFLALYFTITNTIKLTVYARQELIRNMQYVGATYWYIRTPFLLEGVIQGGVGALLAWSGLSLISLALQRFSLFWGGEYLLPVMIAIGTILGFVGSLDAVRNVRHSLK